MISTPFWCFFNSKPENGRFIDSNLILDNSLPTLFYFFPYTLYMQKSDHAEKAKVRIIITCRFLHAKIGHTGAE